MTTTYYIGAMAEAARRRGIPTEVDHSWSVPFPIDESIPECEWPDPINVPRAGIMVVKAGQQNTTKKVVVVSANSVGTSVQYACCPICARHHPMVLENHTSWLPEDSSHMISHPNTRQGTLVAAALFSEGDVVPWRLDIKYTIDGILHSATFTDIDSREPDVHDQDFLQFTVEI